jgi:hypothetical protein
LITGVFFGAIYRWAPRLPLPGIEIDTVYLLGIIAVLLILFVLTYSVRKRLARGMPGRLDSWLWAHIYLGLLALFIIALHAEFRFGWDYNTLALLLLALVVITGVVGRYFYSRIPASIADEQQKILSRVDDVTRSIKNLLEKKSRPFQKIIGSELTAPSPISAKPDYWSEIRAKSNLLPESEREDFKRAIELLEQKSKLETQSIGQLKYRPLFRAWLAVHLLVTVGLIIIIPLHVLDDSFRVFPLKASDFGHPQECRQCHQRQYDEWIMSPHAYGQMSPVNVALNAKTQEDSKGKVGTFCFKCHGPVSIAIGEDGIMSNEKRQPIGLLGVQCDSCHGISKDPGLVSGDFPLEPSRTKYGPFGSGLNGDHKAKRNSFHRSVQSDYIQSSEFCGSCHDVITPPGLRVEETYSEWKQSVYAEKGIKCQDCHMRTLPGKPDQKKVNGPAAIMAGVHLTERELSNHAMTGVDYHLIDYFPYADNPGENARIQRDYMQEVYELHKGTAKMEVEAPNSVTPGSEFQVAVHVTNTGAGHNLPSGFTPERQMWIEIYVRDGEGKLLFVSGDFDNNEDLRNRCSVAVKLEETPLDKHLVSFNSEMLRVNPDGTEEDVFLTSQANKFLKKGIPPLETKTGIYPVRVPLDAKGPLKMDVRLRFRNFSPLLFDRLGLDESLKKRIVIIDMASDSKSINVENSLLISEATKQERTLVSNGVYIAQAAEANQETVKGIIMSIDEKAGIIEVKDGKGNKHTLNIDPKLLEGLELCNAVEIKVEDGKVITIRKL